MSHDYHVHCVLELHAQDFERAVQHLPMSNNSCTLGIGVTGMKGIGKTTFLSAVCRSSKISAKFKYIYWISVGVVDSNLFSVHTSTAITPYQLLIDVGKQNQVKVENVEESCQRAVEKLILQSNDAMLLVVDNVTSMQQIYGIKTGMNGSQNSSS